MHAPTPRNKPLAAILQGLPDKGAAPDFGQTVFVGGFFEIGINRLWSR